MTECSIDGNDITIQSAMSCTDKRRLEWDSATELSSVQWMDSLLHYSQHRYRNRWRGKSIPVQFHSRSGVLHIFLAESIHQYSSRMSLLKRNNPLQFGKEEYIRTVIQRKRMMKSKPFRLSAMQTT